MQGYYPIRQHESRKRFVHLFFIITIIGCLFSLASELAKEFLIPNVTTPIPAAIQAPKVPGASLSNIVQKELEGTKGNYGIIIKNLKTNESYYLNERNTFNSASLYKLWVMAAVYEKVKNGELKEQDILSKEVKTLNEKFKIESTKAEQTKGTITYSVNDALAKMITISDNYAALLLTERIRLSSVASWLQRNNFNESKVGTSGGDPTTTAFDIASFFEKLAKVQLTNQEYTQKMIDLLKTQTLNEKLPKYLPENINIAHKTGEKDLLTHDGGIIFTPSGDYIIVVLSETDAPALAKERIAVISEAVYNYFTK